MLGRSLFALVLLIIAAGVVLPIYPADVVGPDRAGAQSIWQVADVFGCPAPDAEGCAPMLSARGAPHTLVTITVHFTVEPVTGRPDLPKLPAI